MSMQDGSFYDNSGLDEIDQALQAANDRPLLIDQMQEKADERESRRAMWSAEFRSFWYVYFFLGVSAFFTTMLGIYMGLAPTLIADPLTGGQKIYFNTDAGHILTAVIYVIAFLSVTEFAFIMGKLRFHNREEGNSKQMYTMLGVMGLGGLSIIVTGIAGGEVVASVLGLLDQFAQIPAWAQKWVVWIIPILLGVYAFLFTTYQLSSRRMKAKRLINEQLDRQRVDMEYRKAQMEAQAAQRRQAVDLAQFQRAVEHGLMSSSEADYFRKQGKSIMDAEKALGRDLNGDRVIGPASGRQAAQPGPRPGKSPNALPCGHSDGVVMNSNTDGYVCRVCAAPVSIDDLGVKAPPRPVSVETSGIYRPWTDAEQEAYRRQLKERSAGNPPQTFEYLTAREVLEWLRDNWGWGLSEIGRRMMAIPTVHNAYKDPDGVYDAWYPKNILPANLSRENFREVHAQWWADIDKIEGVKPVKPAPGKNGSKGF